MRCCVSFQGDGEEPNPELSSCSICAAATAQQQSHRADSSLGATDATATGGQLLPTPQASLGRRAS